MAALRRSGAALLWLAASAASAAIAAPSAPPPPLSVVEFYTRPLVRARLRAPDSLRDYQIASLVPSADDPQRFEVEVRFRAQTPFGAITAHSARFQFRQGAPGAGWMVTAH